MLVKLRMWGNMDKPKQARVLLYDIESMPIIATVWGKYEQNFVWSIQDWYIFCFAYKWLGEKKTHVVSIDDFSGYKVGTNDDKQIVKRLHELFNEADVIVAHNGDSFDQKKTQARMIINGFDPPAPYKQIDTKKVAKRYFNFTSNKLDDLGTYLGLGNKLETGGYELWKKCMEGEKKSITLMKKYNKQDVVLLEKVYLKMRPWMTNHPKMGVLDGRPTACDNCGHNVLHQHTKKALAGQGWRMQYKCAGCGHYQIGTKLHKFDTKLQ